MLRHSLISESVFHVATPDGTAACTSLPQVLARLSVGQDLDFTGLRPHQRAPWHAFLVQLAYLALEDDDEPVPPTSSDGWARRLRELTPGYRDESPWCLVNDDWQTPAFMQPPCSAQRAADFKRSADAAQDIDVLVTARHHDEKTGKLPFHGDALDALVYALVDLQGGSSYLGAGNYYSMRMNSGYSSRPQFRLAYQRGTGAEFRRDLAALLATRDDLVEAATALQIGTGRQPSHRLLWLPPWDSGSLPLSHVHPLCLEVCRRVRLEEAGGQLIMRRASSDAMRVNAKAQRGVVLDPWVPIVLGDERKALTAQAHTLGYRSLQGLLFDNSKTQLPTLARPTEAERRANQPGTFIAQVLVTGDGRTDGLLRRELPMSAPVLTQFVTPTAALAHRSQLFVNLAGQASGKAYRSALLQFVDGSDDVDWKNRDFVRAVEPWVDLFEQTIDDGFFEQLFATIDLALSDEDAQRAWAQWLERAAHASLAAPLDALPTRHGSRLFSQSRAERLLRQSLHKQFGELLNREPSASSLAMSEEVPP